MAEPVPSVAPRTLPRLDILFFDVDDTLYSTTEFAEHARRNAVHAMIEVGLKAVFETAVAELDEVVAEFSSNYPDHFGRLLDRLGPEASRGVNRAVLTAAGVVAYHRTKERDMRILPDVAEVLARCRDAGVRLGVISAGLQVKQAEKLLRLNALAYFDPQAIFFSDQLGVGKPNPKIYLKACQLAGVNPTRALYVGDRGAHDVEPAAQVGMRTVHYRGAGGKYADEPCRRADHHLTDLRDLLPILREAYGVPVGAP